MLTQANAHIEVECAYPSKHTYIEFCPPAQANTHIVAQCLSTQASTHTKVVCVCLLSKQAHIKRSCAFAKASAHIENVCAYTSKHPYEGCMFVFTQASTLIGGLWVRLPKPAHI